MLRPTLALALTLSLTAITSADAPLLMPLGDAWAANSVNAVIFRNDPITTHGDKQFAAYYDADGKVVIATRTIGQTNWTLTTTDLTGNVKDAHNSISLIADGEGYLHISWDHHGHPLRYARSKTPGTPDFGPKQPMVGGQPETNVTYPQFFQLADGDLLCFFRSGASGRGNLVLNRYDVKTKTWSRLHDNLISGEGQRNAYWQSAVGTDGSIHLSWVWRESPDVASNHDLCYAKSADGGKTWQRSDGTKYELPITAKTAEIALAIPQRSELMNQTSMCVDGENRPVIATYFRPAGASAVQYMLVRHDGTAWQSSQIGNRTKTFSLSGGGTKQVPISRPQVFARTVDGTTSAYVVYRDVDEHGGKALLAACDDASKPGTWRVTPITDFDVKSWEPSYDHVRWARDGVLNLFVQPVGQGDDETLQAIAPTQASVLEWKP